MGGHLVPGFHHWLHGLVATQNLWLMQFLLVTLVLLWPGARFFRKGVPALLRASPDMNSLVSLGAGAAWAYSVLVTFAPGLVPEDSRAVYYEAAAVIVTLILFGRSLEARARGRAGAAIARLVALPPCACRPNPRRWQLPPFWSVTGCNCARVSGLRWMVWCLKVPPPLMNPC
jgi:cation transport ATPase